MKFTKGLLIGGLIKTGIIMMYHEKDIMNKNKVLKKENNTLRRWEFYKTTMYIKRGCLHIPKFVF